MGMDVFGNAPRSPKGGYFRRNVWGWRPLWMYVEDRFPEIASKVVYAQTNDGDGLDDADSAKLAQLLRQDIESGAAAQYINERNQELNNLADEECEICSGTGQRPDGLHGVTWKHEGCNSCLGKGTVRPFATYYGLELDDLKEFAEFLEHCGGFAIC